LIFRENKIFILFYHKTIKELAYNFDKYEEDEVDTLGFGYDYDSTMHYDQYGFSVNGLPTILPKNRSAVIGQIKELSEIDAQEIRAFYQCK
jgi:hypothetical protein